MHVHYFEEEAFTVGTGRMGYQRMGDPPRFAGPGETVLFRPGEPHRFWNAGDEDLVCTGYVEPAGNVEYLLTEIFESTRRNGGKRPNMFDAAFLMRRYRSEFALTVVPPIVQWLLFPLLVAIGKMLGKYRRFADAPEPMHRGSRSGRAVGRTLVCASVFLLGACATSGAPPAATSVTRLDGTRIDTAALTRHIDTLTRAANVQGLTVAVFNDASPVYVRAFGFGDEPAGKPLRTDTEIYGASLSKAVFSVLVMKLVEQGVLSLDKPLQEYVTTPLYENRGTSWHEDLSDLRSDARYRRITARMSMSHTTGLPNWRWFEPDHKLRIHFEPGARFSYSGEGMTLLQIVIQHITGKSLEQLMLEHVFGPYGMTMSSYTWQPRFEADYAVGHAADGKVYPKDKDNAARAPSTLETTTEDYVRFMTAVLRKQGLSEASWREIFTPQVRIRSRTQAGPGALETTSANDAIELSYGLGWGLQRTPYGWGAFKEGHGDGFQHYSIIYPDKKLGVLLMSNSDNAESIFGHLLQLTIADTFTPLEWENYLPYDRTR